MAEVGCWWYISEVYTVVMAPSYYFPTICGNNEFKWLCVTCLVSLKAQIDHEFKLLKPWIKIIFPFKKLNSGIFITAMGI